MRRSHDSFSAKSDNGIADPFVISGDEDFIQQSGPLAAFPNVLNERLASDGVKRFPEEAGGSPARRKDA